MSASFRLTGWLFVVVTLTLLGVSDTANAQIPSGTVEPQIRVGCVDLAYVANNSKQGKVAFAQLEDLTKKKEAELAERAKLIAAEQGKLQQQDALLNDQTRIDLQRTLQKAQLDFDRFRQDTQTELQQFAERVERDLRARLFPVVDEMSREKGLHLVFTADSPGLMWFSRSVDMSQEVVHRLDSAK